MSIDIHVLACAGEITLVLKNGTDEERSSLLDCIEVASGFSERLRIEQWMKDGMPGA